MGLKDTAPPVAPSELAQLWSGALESYEKITGKAVKNLPSPSNMDEIIGFAEQETNVFGNARHPKGKFNAIRAYLGKNIDYIDTAAEFIADATTAVFPPSKAIYAVISYMLKAAKKVSAALDTIAKCFDEMNTVLERINFLDERKLPNIPGYKTCIMRVFTSLLSIFGISTRYLKSGRAMTFFSKLVKGDDDELQGAYDSMIQAIQRLDPATNMATLRKVGDVELRLIDVQEGVVSGFVEQESQGKVIEAKQDEMLVALAKFRREMATYATPKDIQDSKDKDKVALKSTGKGGSTRKIVALNTIQRVLASPAKPSMQFEEIEQLIVPDTSKWFTSEASYYSWLESDETPVLLIQGESGTGKTFMTFSIIQELYNLRDIHPGTSVAYIFFKEQHLALKSVRYALGSMCSQVAESDPSYCEKISTLIDNYDWDKFSSVKTEEIWQKFFLDQYTLLKSDTSGAIHESYGTQQQSTAFPGEDDHEETAATVAHDLTQHEHKPSTSDETPTLYLVFDGLDELPDVSRQLLISLIKSMKLSTTHIKILLTSRTEVNLDAFVEDIKPILLDLSHEKTIDDIRRFAQARCESLPRLRKFRGHSKKQVVSHLQVLGREKSIGLLYVDRALQYLDSMGREGAVLRVLEQLPHDLDSLYGKILSDCSSRRSPEEAEALKLLFALLAFAKRPLALKEVRWFLNISVPIGALYVDDEIRDRCASMVDLFRSLKYEAHSTAPSSLVNSTLETTATSTNSSPNTDPDDDVPLSFQERSLREFFRKPGPFRLGAHTAHLKMFLTCIEVICNSRDDIDSVSRMGLTSYAATTWLEHLSDIDLPSATSIQVKLVLEALTQLFTNQKNAADIIETTSYEMYNQLGLVTAQSTNSHRQNLLKWANSATLLPKSIFSPAAWSWATRLASGDLDLTYDLTKAHVLNWFNTTDVASAQKKFYTAWIAMRSTRILDSMDCKPGESISAEQTQKLASAFNDIQPTPQAYRAVCLQQSGSWYYKEALQAGKQALSDSLPPKDQFYTWVALSSICCNLADADYFDPSEDYDSDSEANTRHHHIMTKRKTNHAISAQAYAEKALEVNSQTDVATSPEHERWQIQQAHINVACAKRARRLYDEAIEGYGRAKSLGFRQGDCLLQIVVIMSQQREYEKLITIMQGWSTFDYTYLLALNDQDNWSIHELFQKAAVKAGKETFMIEVYQELITILDRDGNAALLRYWLANAYHRILHNADKAKALLNELLDGTTAKDPVTGEDDTDVVSDATSVIADIIYDQFRKSTNRAEKSALLQELAFLPSKQLRALSDFQLYDSRYAISYARMVRKIQPANEYHDFMEQAFQVCMQRLTDSLGSNDGSSFSSLARILITVGGMERDAKIAVSCQFSITDAKIDHTVYSSDSSSNDSDSDEESSSDDDEKSEESTDDDSETESTTSLVKEEHPKTPTQATFSKLKAPVLDDDDGDLAPDYVVVCDGPCGRDMHSWKEKDPKTKQLKTRKIYSCLICANLDLCEDCYQRRIAEDAGTRKPYWRMYCGKDHEYVSGPIEQWRGVKGGKIRIGDNEEDFKVWLDGVKGRWTATWTRFWEG